MHAATNCHRCNHELEPGAQGHLLPNGWRLCDFCETALVERKSLREYSLHTTPYATEIPNLSIVRNMRDSRTGSQPSLYVGRGKGQRGAWGNRYVVGSVLTKRRIAELRKTLTSLPDWATIGHTLSRHEAIALYAPYLGRRLAQNMLDIRTGARILQRNVAREILTPVDTVCWCAPQPCHGDIVSEVIMYFVWRRNRGEQCARVVKRVSDILQSLDLSQASSTLEQLRIVLSGVVPRYTKHCSDCAMQLDAKVMGCSLCGGDEHPAHTYTTLNGWMCRKCYKRVPPTHLQKMQLKF